MSKNEVLKGVIWIGLGAVSYGMLATFVKLAYQDGFTTAEVTASQFIIGIISMSLLNLFQKSNKTKESSKEVMQLLLSGTSIGLTSVFYYLCVKYISVSIAIVLLMQTVWMGVFLEMALDKKKPTSIKMIAVVTVLIGTVLSTNLIQNETVLNWRGIVLGLLAAASFTATMYASNRVALGFSSTKRSLYMLLGGTGIVLFFVLTTQNTPFNIAIFHKWGILLAVFGTLLPPILMNIGFPHTGIGLGSIVSSLELPVSVLIAYFILNEKVSLSQWFGMGLILFAIVIMNLDFKKTPKK